MTTPFDVNSKVYITIMGTKVTIEDSLGEFEAKGGGFLNALMDWEGRALLGITNLHSAAEPPLEKKTQLMKEALSQEGATGSAVRRSAAAKPSNVAAVMRRRLPAKGAQ